MNASLLEKNKVQMRALTDQIEKIDSLIAESERVKSAKTISITSLQAQISETNASIRDLDEQIDLSQAESERSKQLQLLEMDRERVMENLREREERIKKKERVL